MFVRYTIEDNVKNIFHRIKVISQQRNRRATVRAGASTLAHGKMLVAQRFVIKKSKLNRDLVRGVIRKETYGLNINYLYMMTINATKLNVRDFAVKQKWVNQDKKTNTKQINTSRVKESRRRVRVLRWQFQVKRGKWNMIPHAFAFARAGNRLIFRKGKGRLPTQQIFGPSPADMFAAPETIKALETHFITRWKVEYERESNRDA